jgi:hypothetical protein
VSTTRTSLGGVARINLYKRNPCSLALVSDEEFELMECPAIEFGSHRPIETVPSPSNTSKGFKGKCLLSEECELNQCFGDAVIDISDETALLTASLLKMLSGGASLLRLKQFPKPGTLLSHLANRLSRVLVPFGVGSDLNDTQIDTNRSRGFQERLFFNLNRDVEIERIVSIDQIGLTLLSFEEFLLPGSTDEGKMQTAWKRVQDHDLIVYVPGDEMPVKFDRSSGAEGATDLPVEFVSVGYFRDRPNDVVGMKSCL